MKSTQKDHLARLKKALTIAYREKEKAEVGELWQVRVMGYIRSMGFSYPRTTYLDLFGRLVWRLAPAACILALLLGIATAKLDFVSDYEIAKMFVEDPADFSLSAMLNT